MFDQFSRVHDDGDPIHHYAAGAAWGGRYWNGADCAESEQGTDKGQCKYLEIDAISTIFV